MIKYLSCAKFIEKLEESIERVDVQYISYSDFVGNIAFEVREGDVIHTFYSPDANDIETYAYIDFLNRVGQIIRKETEKKIMGDLT